MAYMNGQVGREMRRNREARGLTLRATAREANVNAGALSRFERGLGRPSAEFVADVAAVFGIAAIELAGLHGRPCFFCRRNWDGPALYVTVTNDRHKLTAVSPAFAAELGYQPDEMLENHSYLFVAERDQPAMERRRMELARKGTHIDRIALVAKDGSEQDWQYRMRPLITRDAGVQYVIAWQRMPERRRRRARTAVALLGLALLLLVAVEMLDLAFAGDDLKTMFF